MPRKKNVGFRRGRPGKLAAIATADLQHELERRLASVSQLQRERAELADRLARLDNELSSLGAGGGGGGVAPVQGHKGGAKKAKSGGNGRRGPRKGREGSLASVLHQVLSGKTMSVSDAVEAVKAAGYASQSPNLRNMVNAQLLANRDRFRRVSRGQYTAV